MNKKIKKLILVSLSLILSSALLAGCAGKDSKDETKLLDSNKDLKTKVAIVTQTAEENPESYNSAEAEKLNNEYKKYNKIDTNSTVEHIVLPKDYESKGEETEKIFKKLSGDKDLNVLVLSSNKPGLMKYAKEIKKSRKDILTISADLNEDSKELIKNMDLNFKAGDKERGESIAELAKSLGAERFVYFISDSDMNNPEKKKNLEGIIKRAKELSMPLEEVKIPNDLDEYGKKAFVADKIDYNINKYGKNINIYTFDGDYDEILATKVLDKKFFIAEFSRPNISRKLMDIYGIKVISRQKEDYVWMNSQISAYIKDSDELKRRIASAGADPMAYTVEFAAELGTVLKSKDTDVKKAYNSYFLEQVSFARSKVECGFINKYKGVGNFKIVDPDQVVY